MREVGAGRAVLLITDPFRPAIVERRPECACVAGSPQARHRGRRIPRVSRPSAGDLKTIEVGDRVVTGGAVGFAGALIGFVSQVRAEAQVRVGRFDQLSDVLVVDYRGGHQSDLIAVGAVGFQTSNGEN